MRGFKTDCKELSEAKPAVKYKPPENLYFSPYNYKRFPYAEKLRSELKNKEIAFVYICTPDNDDLWQENIMKYKIDGDNYKLSDDQKIVLYSLFNYEHGTYNMIINKNGVIIDPDADDPNSETIKQQLLTIIEQ